MIELYVYSTKMSPGNQGVFSVPERGDFSKNSDVFLKLNVKLSITHKYLNPVPERSSVPYWPYPESCAKEKGCVFEVRSPSVVHL
jgi:hypothetical protein